MCHLQGTLKSIEGQPLDSQFVLATHSLGVSTWPSESSAGDIGNCNVQLFSQNGKYRFMVSRFYSTYEVLLNIFSAAEEHFEMK